jgi:hypothetical protein
MISRSLRNPTVVIQAPKLEPRIMRYELATMNGPQSSLTRKPAGTAFWPIPTTVTVQSSASIDAVSSHVFEHQLAAVDPGRRP